MMMCINNRLSLKLRANTIMSCISLLLTLVIMATNCGAEYVTSNDQNHSLRRRKLTVSPNYTGEYHWIIDICVFNCTYHCHL